MRTIIETIIAAHFMADAAQVERLAATVVEGSAADGTYLRVVLAHMQSRLGRPVSRRRAVATDTDSVLHVLDTVHSELYPAVMRGVGPVDLPMPERNRRATFARSAASTVRYFIREGGDVRAIDVATITKAGLRAMVQPETPDVPNETRVQKGYRKAGEALIKSAQYLLARGDPDDAQQRIEATIQALETLLDKWLAEPAPGDVGGTTTTIVPGGRRGSGGAERQPAPILHRSTTP